MKNKDYRKQEKRNENISSKVTESNFSGEDGSNTDNNRVDLNLFDTIATRGQPLSIPDLFKSRILYWFSKLKKSIKSFTSPKPRNK